MYIITQNLFLPDEKMLPNPVQTVCVARSSSFLISSSVVHTINASCAPHLCPFVQISRGRGGWPRFIQLIILNHPNVSLCLLCVFLVSMLLVCLFLYNNVNLLWERSWSGQHHLHGCPVCYLFSQDKRRLSPKRSWCHSIIQTNTTQKHTGHTAPYIFGATS